MAQLAIDPETLLGGPRGRRVCWALMTREGTGWWRQRAPESAGPARLAQELTALIDRVDVAAIADATEPGAFWHALEDSVYAAAYWQEPDACDRRLAHPQVSAALRPIAEALSRSPAAQWWTTPMDPESQYEVEFELPELGHGRREPADPHEALDAWLTATEADEDRAEDRPDDPSASFSGTWWSTPALHGLLRSTRTVGSRGPVGLSLVEDALDWTAARCRAMDIRPGATILEIGAPEDWTALVERYPLAVPRSRRHDWWRATGRDAHWAIPDYPAVAADYDGVHVSVMGYLTTAGRALSAGDFETVLAGWGPDETWWLTEAAGPTGSGTRWRLDEANTPLAWRPDCD